MSGRVATRYEINHPAEGLIGTESTLVAAQLHAMRWLTSDHNDYQNKDLVEIWDSMAHVGGITNWIMTSGQWRATGLRIS